jgi:hypothetical protein
MKMRCGRKAIARIAIPTVTGGFAADIVPAEDRFCSEFIQCVRILRSSPGDYSTGCYSWAWVIGVAWAIGVRYCGR